MHSEKKKVTIIDTWYKWYTRNAGHRQHKSDKQQAREGLNIDMD